MLRAARVSGIAYLFTEDPKYAEATRKIMVRFAECYRQWPYRDYWDTYADCDPLYAAWHDKALPIEWKRHLSEQAYAKDTLDKAAMRQNYWGAGRLHPSTDGISSLSGFVQAYDFTCNAKDADGSARVGRGRPPDCRARPPPGMDYGRGALCGRRGQGGGEEQQIAPHLQRPWRALGKCLGLPEYVDVALRGYERVRDASFLYDGFSTESPSYTNMYLAQLLIWFPSRSTATPGRKASPGAPAAVDLYSQDRQLQLMYQSVLDTLLPDGTYLPLSDTHVHAKPSAHILQMGAKRYPETYCRGPAQHSQERVGGICGFQPDGRGTEQRRYPAARTRSAIRPGRPPYSGTAPGRPPIR